MVCGDKISPAESLSKPSSVQGCRLSLGDSRSWIVLASGTLLCLDFLILSYPDFFTRFTSDTISAYLLGTAVLVAVNVALLSLPAGEDDKDVSFPHLTGKPWVTTLVMLCGLSVLAIGSHHWLQQIFTVPIDPMRADMLVRIREGMKSFLQGMNPYRLYYAPWEMPLSYGPVLWMPYILPHALRMDIRFLTIGAALFIAALFAIGATVLAHQRRWVEALALLAVEVTFCLNPALYDFIVIGHTPVYWPLLFTFCYLFSRGRTGPAAVALGLLIVARTSMVALVPVFFIYVLKDQIEGGDLRSRFIKPLLYFCLAAILPFLPFAILNFQSLWYGIVTRYPYIVKRVVWRGTDGGIFRTFGTTGFLLSRGWQHYVESVQAGVLLAFYVLGWFRIKSRGQALRWMGMALLVFSMTLLWPVYYLYLDVFVLLGAAFVVQPRILGNWLPRVRLVPLLAGTIFALAVVLFGTASYLTGNFYEVDLGTATARRYLASGFDKDEFWGKITFSWATTTSATIRLPRLSRSAARLVIVGHPFVPPKNSTQAITAVLNGQPIGTKQLSPGWEAVSFVAPPEVWQIGLNQLELRFRYAHSPKSVGLSEDSRPLAVAIDKVVIAKPNER